jgi:tetratricopeptide (TPR) repeat protein
MRRISLTLFFFFLIYSVNIAKAEAKDRVTSRALPHYVQAGIYERLNQLDKATREYKIALKADYSSPLPQAAEELKLAIKYYNTQIPPPEKGSSFIEAHTLLALVYSLQGKIEEATSEYETALRGAIALEPENIRIHKSLGRVYLRKNKFSDAEKTYRFILNLAPSDSEAHFFLGTIYEEQDRRNEAIEEFKVALKLNPEFPEALNSLGYLYAEESINLKQAEGMIKKALIHEPNNGAYIDSLGWVYFQQGRYQEAVAELEQAIQFLSDPIIYEHLGDAYQKQGNLIKARENWQESLKLGSEQNLRVEQKLEKILDN